MLEDLRQFVMVAEKGSFAAAARVLDVVPSTVSKRVASLEEHYGVRLMQRTTRSLSLTEEGRILYDQGRDLLERFRELERRLVHHATEPRGTLSITTIPAFGQLHLARLLPRFHRSYPDLRVELTLTDRVVDMVEERCDVAIRFGALPDSDLQARKLGENLYYLCASPEYLEARGRPAHPRELDAHDCLTDHAYEPLQTWAFDIDGERVVIEPDGPLQTEDPVARYYATLGGMGIAALPRYVIREAVQRGELEILFPKNPLRLGQIWALHLSRDHVPARISVFLDFAVTELGALEDLTEPG